jgi:hypothetical protein
MRSSIPIQTVELNTNNEEGNRSERSGKIWRR